MPDHPGLRSRLAVFMEYALLMLAFKHISGKILDVLGCYPEIPLTLFFSMSNPLGVSGLVG